MNKTGRKKRKWADKWFSRQVKKHIKEKTEMFEGLKKLQVSVQNVTQIKIKVNGKDITPNKR